MLNRDRVVAYLQFSLLNSFHYDSIIYMENLLHVRLATFDNLIQQMLNELSLQ